VSARDKVTFLESLLERVRRNAAAPRQRRAVAAPPAPPAAPEVAAQPPPVADTPPPSTVQPPPETVKVAVPALHEVAIPPVTEMLVEEPDATLEVVELLDEAEIVDITLDDELDVPAPPPPAMPPPAPSTLAAAAAAAGKGSDIDFDEEDDRPPSSSRRPKLGTSSLDEALEGAAQLDDEHEVPIKTPPPESGPQEALPPPQVLQQPPLELDEPGMEAELARSVGPAPEQVGNTIELEEPAGPSLELDSLPAESGPQPGRSGEELEADLAPSKQPTPVPVPIESEPAPELTSAVVPVSAPVPPPEPPISFPAEPRSVSPETLSLSAQPLSVPTPEPHVEQLLPPVATHMQPEVVKRPGLLPVEVQVPVFVRAHREFSPSTFVELLDASLGLGR
jgi:hypothetical protein